MAATDPYDLERFVRAQANGVYEQALAELRQGRKTSHWMWFVFPQVAGLGHSSTAVHYAISGMEEAHAYLQHPLLEQRLVEASRAVADGPATTAEHLLGHIDAVKLRSSMTLFEAASPGTPVFRLVLERYFHGDPDPRTLRILGRRPHDDA
ncbi:Uncharacterized protein, DUF1810 family [Raineyella antarctica]|uniref:Uncharacterized protein, DUF1810 family n=1 Tax=Raineyella antarctica TaxID=1577474 RepID=A0A1G6HI81_9ACTN|nr:DUF1810 domain-containing protein [Raineyella antarctica]SDB93645.1 Uncharacterized protein, DUF1810 family [Raineyella antarctica]